MSFITFSKTTAAGILLGTTALSPALAQTTGTQSAAADAASEGEIVVTALRGNDKLQNVPAAVQVFGAKAIEASGIQKPLDFISLTSNVNFVETQNAGTSFVIIRGITQARNSEPSVAVVVDGIQQVNPAQFNQELFDLDQIEVLKGPQGGLYGRNAIGGAIIIRSKAPSDVLSGKLTGGIESGFGYSLRGSLSGPIAPNVKFRVAGSWRDTKGLIRNTFLNEKADPVKDLNLRANLLWTPTTDLSIDLRGAISRLKTRAFYYNIVTDVNDTSLPVRVNNRGIDNRDMNNLALKISYKTDIGTFSSTSSYDTVSEILTGDGFDFKPIPESLLFQFFGIDINQSQYLDVSAYSQDLRYESPADRPLQAIVGGYFIKTDRFISTGNLLDTGNGVTALYRAPSTNPLNPSTTFLADGQSNFAWALYANAIWKLNDQVRVDASLRYDRDHRENTTLTPANFLNAPGFPTGTLGEVRTRNFSALQPKLTLTWKPVPSVTVYSGYSEGFRSGGFNQTGVGASAVAASIVGVGDIFEAEKAKTFEAGFKTRTSDGLLSLNAAAYTTQTRNSYFFVFLASNSTQNLGNVPEVRLKGFEIDATLRPAPGLELTLGYGFTDSRINRFPDARRIGNQAPLISRDTLNLGLSYAAPLSDTVTLNTKLDYRRIGRTWFDVENSTSRNPVDLFDARVGLDLGQWTVTAFAQNLFDKKYNAEFSPGGFVFKARPRRLGAEVSYKF